MLVRSGDGPSIQVAKRLRVPTVVAIVSLPIVFVIVQLGAALVHRVVVGASGRATEPGASEPLAALAGMTVQSALLLLLAGGIPLGLSLSLPRALGLRAIRPATAGWAVLGTLGLSPAADSMMSAMARLFPEMTLGSIPMLHELAQRFPWLVIWPIFALLPGMAEEAFFRGYFLRSFANVRVGIWVSGGCFALFHLDPHHIAGVLPLGLFLSWVAARHGLWASVVAHVANNTVALLSIHMPEMDVGYGTDQPMPFYWLPIGLCVTALAYSQLMRQPGKALRTPA